MLYVYAYTYVCIYVNVYIIVFTHTCFCCLPYEQVQIEINIVSYTASIDLDQEVVGWCEGAVYFTSPGHPTDIGLQLGKACYPCSG